MNLFLGAILLIISLTCLNGYFFHSDWFQGNALCRTFHAVFPLVLIMPLGPLIFFYAKSVTNNRWRLSRKEHWHFLPILIDLIPYLVAITYLVGGFERQAPGYSHSVGFIIDNYNTYADVPRWFSVSLYLYIAYDILKDQEIKTGFQKWLRLFLLAFGVFQCLWLIFMIPYLLPQYNIVLLNTVGWYPVFIPLVVLIYWLGIKGYLISKTEKAGISKSLRHGVQLTATTTQEVAHALTKAMEEDQLFLNPNLNLTHVSKHIGTGAKIISAVLNDHLNLNFNQWVNGYRVAAFKLKVRDEAFDNLTLTGIAFECGFNSQASFQRVFKKLTGTVPSSYRNSL